MRCIICRNEAEPSLEHIVPRALGNDSYVTDRVCKTCNSLMGEKIDAPMTGTPIAILTRKAHGIAGASGKVPETFGEGVTEDGLRVRLSSDLRPTLIETVEETERGFTVHASSPERAIEIAEKKLKRANRPPLTEAQKSEILSRPRTRSSSKITCNITFRADSYLLGLIKIAYETLFKEFGEAVLSDSGAEELRQLICETLYEDRTDYERLQRYAFPLPSQSSGDLPKAVERLRDVARGAKAVHLLSIQPRPQGDVVVLLDIQGMMAGAVRFVPSTPGLFAERYKFLFSPEEDFRA